MPNIVTCPNGHQFDISQYSSCPYCFRQQPFGENFIYCPNKHLYDASKYFSCPVCGLANTPEVNSPTLPIYTQNLGVMQPTPDNVEDNNLTQRAYSVVQGKTEPTVGWLVCIDGAELGRSFQIKSSRNFIGRSPVMDIVIDDPAVSREKHAVVTYVPKQKLFIIQPGDSHELFYLNGKVVLENEVLTAYDRIVIGQTTLLFVPLCGEDFSWEEFQEENK